MALKRTFNTLDTFSMSSMTDVIFLLLIFFMVTSTLIFPAAIDVNLPQSSEQTSKKPLTEIYVDSLSQFYIVLDRTDSIPSGSTPRQVSREELIAALTLIQQQDSTRGIALYADEKVEYGKIVELLDMAARKKMKMVLATKALQESSLTE
ncbi:MAG: biopolymer transporter ExbD [Muribaculaceae bacterium]|nr:biopolymer transporter ExbD [Muribaculaceae bacterium]